jgi:hypothetical protein
MCDGRKIALDKSATVLHNLLTLVAWCHQVRLEDGFGCQVFLPEQMRDKIPDTAVFQNPPPDRVA